MAGFPKAKRQAMIDDYLVTTGHNQFVPGQFVDWLSGQPDHEAFPWFFAKTDEEAAREFRIGLARQMASGLRIVAQQSEPKESSVVCLTVREYPAMVSPVSGRRDGGGYNVFSPDDPAMVAELRGQGAQVLVAWLARYRGVAEQSGVDLLPIEEIVTQMRGDVAGAA